jgi:hypothetical protein
MDLDTAVFLDMCQQLANDRDELAESDVVIAFMVASVDVIGRQTPAAVAKGYHKIREMAMLAGIPRAEEEGYVVIAEEV